MELETNKLIKISDEVYFALEGYASSSASKKILRKSPAHILNVRKGSQDALILGKVAHHLILEGDTFHDHWRVKPEFKPISDEMIEKYGEDTTHYPKTAEYKKQVTDFDALSDKRDVCSQEDYDHAIRMCHAVYSSSMGDYYLNDGDAEMTLLTTIEGVPVKIKLDYIKIDHDKKLIEVTDVKTCRDASEKKFCSAIYWGDGDLGDYNLQAVFYIEALRQIYPDYKVEWRWCAIEKGDNPQACWYGLSSKAYDDGKEKLDKVLPEWNVITTIDCYSKYRATQETVWL